MAKDKKKLDEDELKALLEESEVDPESIMRVLANNDARRKSDSKPKARGHGNAVPERKPIVL